MYIEVNITEEEIDIFRKFYDDLFRNNRCEGQFTGIKFRANPEWVHKCVNDFNAELKDRH